MPTKDSLSEAHISNEPVIVVGTGSIGMRHLRVFRDMLQLRSIAVPKRASRVAELKAEGYEAFPSLAEAVEAGGRLLVVASDSAEHLYDAEQGIALGCQAVLMEKPIAPTVAGTERLATVAQKIDGRIFVGCNLRFEAGIRRFRERLPEIGDIHHVRIEAQSFLPEWRPQRDYRSSYSASAEQGGVLRDLIHEVDYATWLFGRPSGVLAFLSNSGTLGIAAEESADLAWRTPSDATISLRLDYVTRPQRRVMTAFGPEGELSWNLPAHTVTLTSQTNSHVVEDTQQDRDSMMAAQATAFLRAAAGDPHQDLATLSDGIFAIALCDAARRSSSTGRMETICREDE